MKKILGITLLLLAASLAQAASVTVTFTYDFTVDTACSATVSANCVDHFEVFDVTNTARVLILSIADPATPSATGPTVGISGSFKLGPPYGSRTINVVAVAKDSSGGRIESSPAAVIFSIKPASPQGLTATVQ